MADSFQQRISLEGAEDILAKLKAIGAEATVAFGNVKKSLEAVNPALAGVSTASNAAQQGIAGFTQALGGLSQVLGPVSSGMTSLLSTFTAFGRAGGALAAVGGLALFTKSAADSVIATQNMARAFGLTIEQYKALGKAAAQAGVDQDTLNTALGRFSQKAAAEAKSQLKALFDITEQIGSQIPQPRFNFFDPAQIEKFKAAIASVEPQVAALLAKFGVQPSPFLPQLTQQLTKAALASEEFRNKLRDLGIEVPALSFGEKVRVEAKKLDDSFASMGITLLDLQGKVKPTFDQILDFAEKIKNTPDGTQKAALAIREFGRAAGPELLPVLNQGREGIEAIQAALAKQGIGFSEEQINSARQFRQALIELDTASNSLSKSFLQVFGPVATGTMTAFANTLTNLKTLFKDFGKDLFTLNISPGAILSIGGVPFDDFFRDKLSGLAEIFGLAGQTSGQAFAEGLRRTFPIISAIIDGIKSLLGKGGEDAAATLKGSFGDTKVGDALKDSVNNLPKVFQFAGASATGLGTALTKTGQAGKTAFDGINNSAKAVKDQLQALKIISESEKGGLIDLSIKGPADDTVAAKRGGIFPDPAAAQAAANAMQDVKNQISDAKKAADALGKSIQIIQVPPSVGTQIQQLQDGLTDFLARQKGAALDIKAPDTTATKQAFNDIGTSAEAAAQQANQALQNIKAPDLSETKTAMNDLGPAAQEAGSAITVAFESIQTEGQKALDITNQLIAALRDASSIQPTGDTGGGDTTTAARGGYIWGPGTGTSDSILARLSRGEYVIKAAAVSHYGSGLLAALNAMRLPRLPGFALGGLAEGLGRTLRANLAIPGLAVGGAIPAPARAATVPITLDLRTDRGHFRGSAMADRDVAEALSRFAVIDQITSVGRKSGAY